MADTEAAIRIAALELFAAEGYPATTMERIASRVGIRAPSIYNHVESKQQLLVDIMIGTMTALSRGMVEAIADVSDPTQRLRRAVESHVRYHVRHRQEAFVGNRELDSLEPENRRVVLRWRKTYATQLRELVEAGVAAGVFRVDSVRLTSFALLDMGIGVSTWYRPHGPLSEDEIVEQYGTLALRLVDAHR